MENIHASCICWRKKGVLILGDSGAGKSDLSLRLIMDKQAKLVADDRVNIEIIDNKFYASPPKILEGKIEVRGVGILSLPFQSQSEINLVVKLVKKREEVDRYPEAKYWEFKGVKIPLINLYSFDISTPNKVILSLSINKHDG